MRALILLLALAGVARADDVVVDRATAAERTLLGQLDLSQFIKARDGAEAILAKTPDSFVANWAMAIIHHNEEGNHARALFYVRRAQDILASRYGLDPEWHKKLLIEEAEVLREMDRNADALKVIDRYEARYGPGRIDLRIWPLFKLGRTDEARAIATRLAGSDDWNERAHGFNSMMALEYEAHDREASYRWGVDAVRATQEKDCVILRNAAGSAFTRFRLREAEDFALRAHKAKVEFCPHAGYDQLAGLYTIEGEFQKALSALETLKAERIQKRYRPHFALTRRTILADLLYALGKVDEAERMAAELHSLPQRTGMTSSSAGTERLARSFRYATLLDARLVLLREKSSYRSLLSGMSAEAVRLAVTHWEIKRALMQLAGEGDVLVSIARPNLGDLNDWTAWRLGGLIDLVGAGVMRAAVKQARRLDAKFPEAIAYLDALSGEIAFHEGNWAEADRLATQALPALPREEALLRWRTQAWQAEALRRMGRIDAARPLYHEVLQKFPPVLRYLELRVPATISDDGSDLARKAARRLRGSTRFAVVGGAPFRLAVAARGGAIEVCLTDDSGFQFACATGEKKPTEEDTILSGLDAFHAAAFSPRISLKQSDLQSLDGSPVRVGVDEVLKGVVEP